MGSFREFGIEMPALDTPLLRMRRALGRDKGAAEYRTLPMRLAPRCNACTRSGRPCRSAAMANGRCRMHGGASTGPRTDAGRARCKEANLRHGWFAAEEVARRRDTARLLRRARALIAFLDAEDRLVRMGLLPPWRERASNRRLPEKPVQRTIVREGDPRRVASNSEERSWSLPEGEVECGKLDGIGRCGERRARS
jgi:hypothetical protein